MGMIQTFLNNLFQKNDKSKDIVYYTRAFAQRFENVLKETEYKKAAKDETKFFDMVFKLSYFRALSCFYKPVSDYRAELDNSEDRRTLQYSYMSSDYDISKDSSTLNRYRFVLPITNLVDRILNLVCNLYDDEPRRIFYENNENAETLIKDIYDELNLISRFKELHKLAKLTGLIAIRVFAVNDKFYMRIKTPDMFFPEFDEMTNEINKVTFFDYSEYFNKRIYHVWTNNIYYSYLAGAPNMYIYYDEINGEYMKETQPRTNPYGQIPFVFLHYGAGMLETIESNLYINKLNFQAGLSATYDAIQYKIAINIPKEEIPVSPDEIITIPGDMEKNEFELPDIRLVQGNGAYMEIDQYAGRLENKMFRNEDIPNSMINETSAQQSGIAKLIEERPLNNKRRNEINLLKKFETDIAKLIVMINNLNTTNSKLPEIENFSIDYEDPSYFMELIDEYEFNLKQVRNYTMDITDFYSKWGGLDSKAGIDELKKIIEGRKQNKVTIETITGPETNGNVTETGVSVNENADNVTENEDNVNNIPGVQNDNI